MKIDFQLCFDYSATVKKLQLMLLARIINRQDEVFRGFGRRGP